MLATYIIYYLSLSAYIHTLVLIAYTWSTLCIAAKHWAVSWHWWVYTYVYIQSLHIFGILSYLYIRTLHVKRIHLALQTYCMCIRFDSMHSSMYGSPFTVSRYHVANPHCITYKYTHQHAVLVSSFTLQNQKCAPRSPSLMLHLACPSLLVQPTSYSGHH